jgi:hypothetical protein
MSFNHCCFRDHPNDRIIVEHTGGPLMSQHASKRSAPPSGGADVSGILIWFAFKGWSVLLLTAIAAVVSPRDPLLAHWTQTFMRSAAGFLAQFFLLCLLGAQFGKLMEDSGSVTAIADFMIRKLGTNRVILAVVLGAAIVAYGGVTLFVAFFVIAPMAQDLLQSARIPRRLMPATIMLGTSTFTMWAMPGTPSIHSTIPMPFLGTAPFAAPGLGVLAALIMLGVGLRWLQREEAAAKGRSEGFGDGAPSSAETLARDEILHLVKAVEPLREPGDRMVLGPASDGGYSFIGLKQPHKRLFTQIAWEPKPSLAILASALMKSGLPRRCFRNATISTTSKMLCWLQDELAGHSSRFRGGGCATASRAFLKAALPISP